MSVTLSTACAALENGQAKCVTSQVIRSDYFALSQCSYALESHSEILNSDYPPLPFYGLPWACMKRQSYYYPTSIFVWLPQNDCRCSMLARSLANDSLKLASPSSHYARLSIAASVASSLDPFESFWTFWLSFQRQSCLALYWCCWDLLVWKLFRMIDWMTYFCRALQHSCLMFRPWIIISFSFGWIVQYLATFVSRSHSWSLHYLSWHSVWRFGHVHALASDYSIGALRYAWGKMCASDCSGCRQSSATTTSLTVLLWIRHSKQKLLLSHQALSQNRDSTLPLQWFHVRSCLHSDECQRHRRWRIHYG